MPTHQPVMVADVLRLLLENDGTRFIDCTVGLGGHSAALLERAGRQVRILGIDCDPQALVVAGERLSSRPEITLTRGSYTDLRRLALEWGVPAVDGILADFGVSSHQLDDPSRGFSHRFDAPLDLRYNPAEGVTAAMLVNETSEVELARLLKEVGEERAAGRIASWICRQRPIETTGQLAAAVRRAAGAQYLQKTLARVFMALRVAVNDELTAIEAFLPAALDTLLPGGRMVCISYDSHQDRRVKEFLRKRTGECTCPPGMPVCRCGAKTELEILTKKPLRPSPAEVNINPRSRSAKLRAAEKLRAEK